MTGGGLIALVAYGAQNVLLSGNPEMTYWYKIFRRYSHYAQENVSVALEGQNELFFSQPIKLRVKLQRIGDLLSDMYFSFRIPDIYSKYVQPQERTSQWQYEWVRFLGAAIIQNAAFFVGGQKIQEVDGTYLLSRALIDYDANEYEKWRIMVGDVPELTDPANGIYAGGTESVGYPNVFLDPNRPSGAQLNRPSIPGQEIHVPLGFWFSDNPSQALPLVALQYHDCEVQIILNSIQDIYTILDASGYRVNPLYKMSAPTQLIQVNMPEYVASNEQGAEWRYFATDVGASVPPLNGWFLNPRLQCTYVYLTDEERKTFATQPLSYLFPQITPYQFPALYNRQILDLYTHNPIARLLFIQRRSDSIPYKNDFANFSNWWDFPRVPFVPTPGQTAINTMTNSSGLLIPQGQAGILRALRVLADGNEIQEEKPIDYFTKITPWKTMSGKSIPINPIPVYNFMLHSPNTQPSGSINASRIKNFQVEVDFFPLPPEPNYVYDLTIYVESLNFFEVAGGMGGLKYAL
jgi:hypothetical protein